MSKVIAHHAHTAHYTRRDGVVVSLSLSLSLSLCASCSLAPSLSSHLKHRIHVARGPQVAKPHRFAPVPLLVVGVVPEAGEHPRSGRPYPILGGLPEPLEAVRVERAVAAGALVLRRRTRLCRWVEDGGGGGVCERRVGEGRERKWKRRLGSHQKGNEDESKTREGTTGERVRWM